MTTLLSSSSTTLLLIATAFLLTTVAAQSPAEAPGPSASSLDCTSYLLNMSDCLSYVETGSNLTVPDAACCPELAGMVGSKPVCLCELLSSADSFGIEISLSKAMELPSACGVKTPPVSTCTAAGYPIGGSSPTESPKSPGDIPGAAGNNDSGSSSIAVSQLLYSAGLAIAALSIWF